MLPKQSDAILQGLMRSSKTQEQELAALRDRVAALEEAAAKPPAKADKSKAG